jgi:hypothetical protein
MKANKFLFFGLLLLHLGSAYSQKLAELNSSCRCTSVGVAVQGHLSLQCEGYGKGVDASILNARKNCLDIVLFKGVPNSNSMRPLVPASKIEETRRVINESIGDYLTYISLSSDELNPYDVMKVKKFTRSKPNMVVNMNGLIAKLESEGLINKMGE